MAGRPRFRSQRFHPRRVSVLRQQHRPNRSLPAEKPFRHPPVVLCLRVESRFPLLPARHGQLQLAPAEAAQAAVVQADTHLVPVAVQVAAVQVAQVAALQVAQVAAIGRAASVVRPAEPVDVVVVAIVTNCSRSSPRTQRQTLQFQRASSSSSGVCPHKNSLRNSIGPPLTSFGSS